MTRSLMPLAIVALAIVALAFGAAHAGAQEAEIPEEHRARSLPRQELNGPRFGFTVFTGDVADARDDAGLESIMTQFGWQLETQLVSQQGNQALMEWVLLVGGVEQDEFNVSLSWLTGYRLENGVEFGVGPNFSVGKGRPDPTTSMVVAGGATVPFGDMYLPINMAVSVAKGGPRITMLTGWIVG